MPTTRGREIAVERPLVSCIALRYMQFSASAGVRDPSRRMVGTMRYVLNIRHGEGLETGAVETLADLQSARE
jgi:hypothetical protein